MAIVRYNLRSYIPDMFDPYEVDLKYCWQEICHEVKNHTFDGSFQRHKDFEGTVNMLPSKKAHRRRYLISKLLYREGRVLPVKRRAKRGR